MAVAFSIYNIPRVISTLSPFLISFYFLISSILDNNLKGFVYLLGILLFSFSNVFLFQNFSNQELIDMEQKKPISCGLLEFPFVVPQTSVPCANSVFHGFTLSYLYFSMKNNSKYNPLLLIFLAIIFFVDTNTRLYNKCTIPMGIVIGFVFGIIYGLVWFSIWWAFNIKEVLYYDELVSNNVKCVETKKKFICKKSSKKAIT